MRVESRDWKCSKFSLRSTSRQRSPASFPLITKLITSSIKDNFRGGVGDEGGGGASFSISMISMPDSCSELFSFVERLEAVSDKSSGMGMFTYISINNIKRVIPLSQNSLLLILGFFVGLRHGALDFRLFWGGKTSFRAFFVAGLLVGSLTVIISSIWDLLSGLSRANAGSRAINVENGVFLEGVKKKHWKPAWGDKVYRTHNIGNYCGMTKAASDRPVTHDIRATYGNPLYRFWHQGSVRPTNQIRWHHRSQ